MRTEHWANATDLRGLRATGHSDSRYARRGCVVQVLQSYIYHSSEATSGLKKALKLTSLIEGHLISLYDLGVSSRMIGNCKIALSTANVQQIRIHTSLNHSNDARFDGLHIQSGLNPLFRREKPTSTPSSLRLRDEPGSSDLPSSSTRGRRPWAARNIGQFHLASCIGRKWQKGRR